MIHQAKAGRGAEGQTKLAATFARGFGLFAVELFEKTRDAIELIFGHGWIDHELTLD